MSADFAWEDVSGRTIPAMLQLAYASNKMMLGYNLAWARVLMGVVLFYDNHTLRTCCSGETNINFLLDDGRCALSARWQAQPSHADLCSGCRPRVRDGAHHRAADSALPRNGGKRMDSGKLRRLSCFEAVICEC